MPKKRPLPLPLGLALKKTELMETNRGRDRAAIKGEDGGKEGGQCVTRPAVPKESDSSSLFLLFCLFSRFQWEWGRRRKK